MPIRPCANPKCTNVAVVADSSYGQTKLYCSKRCSNRARGNRYYHRLTPARKKAREAKQDRSRMSRYYANHPERTAETSWKSKGINLTVEQYMALYASQEGRCAICALVRPTFGNGRKGLAPDHCHETGVIRGLLCFRCNTALGVFGDSAKGLERAMHYLTREPPPLL